MIYVLFGLQEAMLKNRIRKIVKEIFGAEDYMSVYTYDLNSALIQDAVSEAESISLMNEQKVIVIENAVFLGRTSKEKIDKNQNFQSLDKYVESEHPDVTMIFCVIDSALSDNALAKKIKKDAVILQFNDLERENWPRYVLEYFASKGATVEPGAVQEIITRCQSDVGLFINNAQKLLINGSVITLADVQQLLTPPVEDNMYLLINAYVEGNYRKTLAIYRDLLINSIEPVTMITTLARQIRLILKIRLLSIARNSRPEIAGILKIKEYPVKLALDNHRFSDINVLYGILEKLYQLDFQIKSGQIDRFYGFERFILSAN